MDFLVLGPLAALHGGLPIDLGSRRRERCLLGLLLLEPGRVFSMDRLIELLWEGEPPPNARATLSSHVSRLRGRLDPDRRGSNGVRLRTQGECYLVEVPSGNVDAHRFRALTATAMALADPAGRSRALADALALWRGPLLADAASDWLRHRVGADLVELRLAAAEVKLDADLAAGRHDAAVIEMAAFVDDNPFREQLVSRYMLALYRSGRQIDALALYRSIRERLARDMGLDPGAALQTMHEAILRRDPDLEPRSSPPVSVAAPAVHGPAQLPASPRYFTGRDRQLQELTGLLSAGPRDNSPAIAAIVGPAGVGKTALALRWATAVRVRFPDGQLYLNLRGFAVDPPVPPIEGLGLLLRALGVPPERVPADTDEAAAAYRTLLADRRILVLLDNAYDVDQVRPLLPSGPACAVVVTSRHRLGGLSAVEGAHRLTLGPLSAGEASTLLRAILGGARVDAEPAAIEQLIEACDRLPLALRVAAANLTEDGTAIGEHVSRLRSGQLAALSVDDDPRATVRATLDLSYLRLPPDARRMFALLSMAPGGDVSVSAAAALSGTTADDARRLVDYLTEAHLLEEQRPGRYTMHDLVGAYAAERLDRDHTTGDRRTTAQRLIGWYLAVAEVTCRLGTPHRKLPQPIQRDALDPGLVPDQLDTAVALLDAERAGLAAATKLALDLGDHRSAWQLAYLLAAYFQLRGDGPDSLAVYEHGLAGAKKAGDQTAIAALHNSLGIGYAVLRRWQAADHHLLQARDYSRRLGDRDGQARALLNLGRALTDQNRLDEALVAFRRSLKLSDDENQYRRLAYLWNNIGLVHLRLGEHQLAIEHVTRAQELFRRRGDRGGEGNALDTLGRVHATLGDHDTALRYFHEALAAHRESCNREPEGDTLANIGIAYQQRGDLAAAIAYLKSAARCHRDIDDAHKASINHRQLAQAYLAKGERTAALSELDVARQLRARLPDAVEEAALRRVLAEADQPAGAKTSD